MSLNQGCLSTIKNLDNSEFLLSFLTTQTCTTKLTSDKIDKKKTYTHTHTLKLLHSKNSFIILLLRILRQKKTTQQKEKTNNHYNYKTQRNYLIIQLQQTNTATTTKTDGYKKPHTLTFYISCCSFSFILLLLTYVCYSLSRSLC